MKIEASETIFHYIKYSQKNEIYKNPLSEYQILDLQESILTNGFQLVKVLTLHEGRSILYPFLKALGIFQQIGCLTDQKLPDSDTAIDIKKELDLISNKKITTTHIDQLFLEIFSFDFIWIEASDTLIESYWFALFEKRLKQYLLHNNIPVLILTT